jgi:polygalacturonase
MSPFPAKKTLSLNETFTNDVILEAVKTINNAFLIQEAIDSCSAQGGGRVILKAGHYCSGTISLRSHVTLHLEKGAVLEGSSSVQDYTTRCFEGAARINNGIATALIFAEGATNIGITGEGIIDGNGETFWEKKESPPDWIESRKPLGLWIPGFACQAKLRPRALVLLVNCVNIKIEDVTLCGSPAWTLHLLACDHVVISRMILRGSVHGSNTDGVDLDACSDVLVEDCDIQTGDDAMCLKNTNTWNLRRPSRRITVRRCRLASNTHGFTIGTETQSDFEEIRFEDSTIEQSDGWRTLTGIGLSILDGGSIRGVHIENIIISDSIAPIQIRLGNAGRGQDVPKPGAISDITMDRIKIIRAFGNSLIAGLPGHPLHNVSLRQVEVEFNTAVDQALVMPVLPEFETEFPPVEVWRFLPAHAFYCRHVEGLELKDVTVEGHAEDARPAFIFKNVTGLNASNVTMTP